MVIQENRCDKNISLAPVLQSFPANLAKIIVPNPHGIDAKIIDEEYAE